VSGARRNRNLAVIGAGLWLFVSGCKSPSKPEVELHDPPPSYATIAKAHNDRVAQLQQLYAVGTIEFRWKDDKGSHFENGHVELWLSLPRRTALRIDKVGEVLLWLGSDDERYWFFDLLSKESSLKVGRHDEAVAADEASTVLGMRPLVMLDLLALKALPTDGQDVAVTLDAARNAWMVQVNGDGVAIPATRMYFDRATLLPMRVEVLDAAGEIRTSSSLRRYQSVTQAGMSPAAFPKFATLIDIFASTDDAANGSVKLALDEATGVVDDQPLDRVFDLERLMSALKPTRVEGAMAP
jgi:hypothetical protein